MLSNFSFYKKFNQLKKGYSYIPPWMRFGYGQYRKTRNLIHSTEFKSKDELNAIQFGLLKKIVDHTWKNIEGYRKYWSSNGFNPEMLKSSR